MLPAHRGRLRGLVQVMGANSAPARTKWLRYAAVGLFVGISLLSSPTGSRAARLQRLMASVSSFVSDGTRHAAWQTEAAGPLVVLDTFSAGVVER